MNFKDLIIHFLIVGFTILFFLGNKIQAQSLVYSESNAMGPLNPYASPSIMGNAERLYSLIYENLYRYDHNSREFIPVLARNITDLGSNIYRIELRNDVVWHDGERFTAEDVVFTYQYITEMAVSDLIRNHFSEAIDTISVNSQYSVDIEFHESVRDHRLYLDAWMIPSHLFDPETMNPVNSRQILSRKPVGTGKYKFVDKDIEGTIELSVNNDHYFANPAIQQIQMERIPDVDLRINRLQSGTSDLIIEIPPARIPEIETNDRINLEPYQSYSITTIGFNFNHSQLENEDLRLAMSLATNREQILNQWYSGRGHLLAGPFTRNAPYFNADLDPLEFNTSRAESLLRAAGYVDRDNDGIRDDSDGNPLQFTLLTRVTEGATQQVQQNVVEDFREMMENIGIGILVENRVYDEYVQELSQQNFDLVFINWTFDPNYDISPIFTSTGSRNIISYRNPQVDELFNRFVRSDDTARRLQYMNRIQDLIIEDYPYIFMFSIQNHAAIDFRFVNVRIDPFYFFSDIDQWETID